MKYALLAATTFAAAAAWSPAQAQAPVQVIAYTAKPVNLRAGPSRDYPVVAVLPQGFQVLVQGCLDTYAWCDITAGYDRGWVYAGNITYRYDDQWRPLISWAPVIGIAVLPFVFDDYWHQHYWNRPFYQDRWRWDHVPPPRYVHPRRPPGERAPAPRPPQPWQRDRPGERHDRPHRPAPPVPGVMPAPQGQPPAPPRPPGWRPEPRVGPAPRSVPRAAPPQSQGQAQQHAPRAPRQGQPQGRERHGPRDDHERR